MPNRLQYEVCKAATCGHQWIPRRGFAARPTACPKCKRPHAARRIQRKTLSCLRCEHEWYQSTDLPPVKCPSCSSPAWNRERQRPGRPRKAAEAKD